MTQCGVILYYKLNEYGVEFENCSEETALNSVTLSKITNYTTTNSQQVYNKSNQLSLSLSIKVYCPLKWIHMFHMRTYSYS